MTELLLLRHGKAKKAPDLPDADRPLKNSGKRGAQRLGAWLQTQQTVPDRVLSSPAERARETAAKCVKAMGETVSLITDEPRLYNADMASMLALVREHAPDTGRLMLVGHNPAIEQLVQYLLPSAALPDQVPQVLPGTLVRIALTDAEALSTVGQGQLVEWKEPTELPETFPFAMGDRIEQRERPAYYYTQSAVIPFKIVDGELKVMMITSSSGRWWGIPKGIVEPGLSEQDSAAKEAMEEAGVIGRVHPEPYGHYRHFKWGANCDVTVYAMAVERELDDQEWQEDHRIRRWLSVSSLPDSIKNKELKSLIHHFPQYIQGKGLWHG